MIGLTQWMRTAELPQRPWLILGKGPTFACRRSTDLAAYNVLGLNHTMRELPMQVGHAIDIDVVKSCGETVAANCRYLLMPRHPHQRHKPGPALESYFDEIPVLRRLSSSGRLVWYNLCNARAYEGSPIIQARYFSVEAALDLLGQMGVTKVQSLGIDGGRGYSQEFRDLQGQTLLANGHESFDLEFDQISAIVKQHGIDYAPLAEPLRIFVGTDETQQVAARVLEYSIQQHASEPVVVSTMLNVPTPRPKQRTNRARTGFSFRRFAIPKLCGYRGRALYVDADMQVFDDIAALWKIPFGDAKVMCTYQTARPGAWKHESSFKAGRQLSVMMLDCSRLDWKVEEIVAGLDEGRYDYRQLMYDLCIVPPQQISDNLPPEWNCLEWYEAGRSKLVHYTVVPTQPWKNDDNPLRETWRACYQEAVKAGAVPPEEVLHSVAAGHITPALLPALSEAPTVGGALPQFDWRQRLKYRIVPPAKALVRRSRRAVGDGLRRFRSLTSGKHQA